MPQESFIGSSLQQNALQLRVSHIIEANKVRKEMTDLSPMIKYREIRGNVKNIEIWNYSDASFNISAGRDYGQTGMI